MDNVKDNNYRIGKIIDDLRFIISHTSMLSIDEFAADVVLQDSMMFRLVQISENVKTLTPEFKNDHPEIPWADISGLRNRIIHDYGHVDLQIVFDTLKEDIPYLLEVFESV